MQLHPLRRVNNIPTLAIIALLILVTGCGKNTTKQSSNATTFLPNKGSLATKQSSNATIPFPNKGSLAITVDGLHIQSLTGIECPLGNAPGRIPPNYLVLATSRVTYDSGELRQMISYLKAFYQTDETTDSINKISMPLPASLLWAAGGYNAGASGSETPPGCNAVLQITNVGNTIIQIPRVDVRFTRSPQQNNFKYRLIDTCTLLSLEECECHDCGAGPTRCDTYYAGIHLGIGQEGSIFGAAPVANGDFDNQGNPVSCGELTLQPSQSTELILNFYTLPPPSHLVYSVISELTLDTSGGQQVLELPQLGSSIEFADMSQFSCYGLQGHTFVLEKPGKPDMHCI